MSTVKVQSVDSLLTLRAALWKFLEVAQSVLSDADGELQRTHTWLETEADSHWRSEIRRRQELLAQAKAALRAKKMFKSDLSQRSVVDEEKAVRLAQARLEEAQRTLEAVHRWRIVLQKEIDQYKSQVQRFAGAVALDIPMAVSRLDALVRRVQEYLALKPGESPSVAVESAVAAAFEETFASMARAEPGEDSTTKAEDSKTRGSADAEDVAVGDDPKYKIDHPQSTQDPAASPASVRPPSAIRHPQSGASHGPL
ncbi:MAG: hypothetical protein AMXMBFR83_01000 [Phycisphaerae bacterium]